MKVSFPDGVAREVIQGTRVRDAIALLDKDVIQGTVGVSANGDLLDLESTLTAGGELKLIKLKDDSPQAKRLYRHSFSHILAQAVKRLYPQAKLAIGPAIDTGFYYDFDVPQPFTPEDLEKISEEMKKIIKENHPFERMEASVDEARGMLKAADEPYKLELLEEFAGRGENITFYRDGEFVDLCRGPHVRFTSQVKHFKLLEVAGAYWRGDEHNKMLQRIYGTAFLQKEDLEHYLWQLEQAKQRDHRRLGAQLDLFSINPETVGSGLVLWHPKGGLMRYLAEEHCKKRHLEGGYDFVYTPHIGRAELWQTSGHLGFYKDSMYAPIDIEGQQYYLKPMNCPFHLQIFRSRMRSYRDLPLRFAEWGTVYRFERSGTLHGLTRVRGFTQDDAHLFCRPDQMPHEIDKVLRFSLDLLRDFGFEQFQLFLSTRPDKRVGDESKWDASEAALEAALQRGGMPFSINPGDGAFYGPKIDIYVKDALERPWQLSTIQFDFNMPQRFDLHYIGEDGKEHQPYMIHRALLGSMERFFGVLTEHHGGAFPVWLAPVQAVVLPIAERHLDYAQTVVERLKAAGLRVELDGSSRTLNYRIRDAQTQKIPYMLVAGDREAEGQQVAVRLRTGEDLGAKTLDEFLALVKEKVESKASC
ncbi:MAG TPA: threonine--tRNA ligase [Candidatus Bipolaricaulota bacterium]